MSLQVHAEHIFSTLLINASFHLHKGTTSQQCFGSQLIHSAAAELEPVPGEATHVSQELVALTPSASQKQCTEPGDGLRGVLKLQEAKGSVLHVSRG